MKKRFLSFALAVLILCAVPVLAHADRYCTLGQVQAGQPVNCYIAVLPAGSMISHDMLPAGCQIFTENLADGLHTYLRGTPTQAGSFTFTISTADPAGEKLVCSITVLPSLPTVYTSADIDCYVGDRALLTASATVADGSTLQYQWYSSQTPANSGGTLILGANAPEYVADTSRAGVCYYYCQVLSSSTSRAEAVCSQPIRVSVSELAVESIMVNSMPLKTSYSMGENFDPAGLTISLRLTNGTERIIDSGFEVSPIRFDFSGQQSVLVSYMGKNCSFPVTVLSLEESIQGIGMVQLPAKTQYNVGETLDTTGLVFRVFTPSGYQDMSDGFVCEPMVLDRAGTQTVTLIYLNKYCTFTVNVKEGAKLLEVASTPRKLSYAPGEALDTSGLVLKLTNGLDTQMISTGYTCEPTVITGQGTQVVKVRYGDLLATFTVSVSPTAASPSPVVTARPTPSPAPSAAVSAQPTAQPQTTQSPELGARPNRVEHDSYETRSNRGTLVVIMVLCILALIVLGSIMVVMNSGGLENLIRRFTGRGRR